MAPIDEAGAKRFVLEHHYAASYPASRFRFGLFKGTRLVGVAVFSHPCNDSVLTNVFGGKATDSVELGRFVLLDSVPGNGESWFLGRAFRLLRPEGLAGVLSFSDPVPRTTAGGEEIFIGHVGGIYQAHNGRYLGRGTPRTLRLLPDGSVLPERAICKIRRREQGWRYACGALVKHGAGCPWEDVRLWLSHWLPLLTRPLRHHGNHKYAWSFAGRKFISLPYPKRS